MNHPTAPALAQDDLHDRLLPGEKSITFGARDWRSPYVTRIYAAMREGRWGQAEAILRSAERNAGAHARDPHKDQTHAWSCRQIADQMDFWFLEHRKAEGATGKVSGTETEAAPAVEPVRTNYDNLALDDAGALTNQSRVEPIKRARPAAEPDEAS